MYYLCLCWENGLFLGIGERASALRKRTVRAVIRAMSKQCMWAFPSFRGRFSFLQETGRYFWLAVLISMLLSYKTLCLMPHCEALSGFVYILAEEKQLSFSVLAIMLFKGITSALPLDSQIFGKWMYVLQLTLDEEEVVQCFILQVLPWTSLEGALS